MMKLSKEQFRKRMITDRNRLKRERARKEKSLMYETERVLRDSHNRSKGGKK